MYMFKVREAKEALRHYMLEHPRSSDAKKALDGDPASMLSVYEDMCGDSDFDDGADYDASMIISEAVAQKYTPAMIRMAEMEMCQGDEYWPEGLNLLYEAMQLGDDHARSRLLNDWHNSVEEWTHEEYQYENELNQYEEYVLGFYYLRGIGIEANVNKAKSYLLKSAANGCDEAEKLLAELNQGDSRQQIQETKQKEAFRKAIKADENHAVVKAIGYYLQALKLGEIRAFRRILILVAENADPLQDEILSRISKYRGSVAVDDADLDFVRGMRNTAADDIGEEDAERLFKIAHKYDIVWECIEEAKNYISSAIDWQDNYMKEVSGDDGYDD